MIIVNINAYNAYYFNRFQRTVSAKYYSKWASLGYLNGENIRSGQVIFKQGLI